MIYPSYCPSYVRLRVVSSFPPEDHRESSVERWESARKVGRGKKARGGSGEGEGPRPTFRALSHLSTLDSRQSPGGKETTRSLQLWRNSSKFFDCLDSQIYIHCISPSPREMVTTTGSALPCMKSSCQRWVVPLSSVRRKCTFHPIWRRILYWLISN